MVEIQTGWQGEIDKAHGDAPFVWLFKVPLVYSASLRLSAAITTHSERITLAGAIDYDPWPCKLSTMEESTEDIPQLTLVIGNQGRLLARYLESPGDKTGLMGRTVEAKLFHVSHSTVTTTIGLRIAGAELTADQLALRLEPPNYFQRQLPQDRYNPRRCRWRFGGPECGYVVNAAAGYTTCDKTLADCVLRGTDMVNRNLGRLQPRRFGGFPSVPET